MKRKEYSLQAEEDAEATLVEPRFDEQAKEAARPVVPLSQVTSADLAQPAGQRVLARRGGLGWPRGMIIMLAGFAVLAVAAAAAIYRSGRTTAPAANTAPQTSSERDEAAAEPETVEAAPEPAAEAPAPEQARESVTAAPAKSPREAEARSVAPAREETERPARDEEKVAKRERKEEKKQAKREEEASERTVEKLGDNEEKRQETRPRLVGIYTERRRP